MLNKQAAALTVEQVQARFQQWRRQKQGRAAIPDELWAAANRASPPRRREPNGGGVAAGWQ